MPAYAVYRSPRLATSSLSSPALTSSPSPSPAQTEERDELHTVLESLHRCEPDDLTTKLHLGGHLHRLLVDGLHGAHSRDHFRDAGGFLVVIQLLSSLESTSPELRSHRRAASLAAAAAAESVVPTAEPKSDQPQQPQPQPQQQQQQQQQQTQQSPSSEVPDTDTRSTSHIPADQAQATPQDHTHASNALSPPTASKEAESAAPRETHHDHAPEMHERLRIEIFKLALSILAEAMYQHPLNLKAFQTQVGWQHLTKSIQLSTIGSTSPDHLFGAVLGLCLGDVSTFSGRIAALRKELKDTTAETGNQQSDRQALIQSKVYEQWSSAVIFPAAALVAVDLTEHFTANDPELMDIVSIIIERMATSSKHNQALLAGTNLASKLLDPILQQRQDESLSLSSLGSSVPVEIRARYLRIIRRLFALGVPDADGRRILRALNSSDVPLEHNSLLDLLLEVAPLTREPNTINFTMAEYGHSSIAFSTLRRPFPPPSSAKGFSLVTSFSIDRIEPCMPLELLHLFDPQRSLSVQLTIEPGTGQLTYSTLKEPPPIRFKQFCFSPGRRYHVAFTHARPKGGAKTSIAKLYVDGMLIEEKLAPWPPASSHPQASPIRAVLGSPPNGQARYLLDDAASQQQTQQSGGRKRINRLAWSLGPTWMLEDILPSDIPLVMYELGSRYSSNAQDSLGRFLTYRASAQINLRLDAVARNATAAAQANNGPAAGMSSSASASYLAGAALSERDLVRHPLVTAIAGKSCDLIHEDRLYFVINAANTALLDRLPRRHATDPGSMSLASPTTAAAGQDASYRSGQSVILNQALPMTKEAMGASFGLAKMYGDPVLITPRGLDELVWKLGGCAVLLKLIDASTSTKALVKTLSLFFELINSSWRLSEDVERSKGYEVLGMLLRKKVHLLDTDIAALLLNAVGVQADDSENAVLVNPFLYRIVMLDFELWAQVGQDIQQLHLSHFKTLLRISKHRRFNIKRVSKMHIAKKFVYALRARLYASEVTEHVITALKAVLTSSLTDVSLRGVTAYLAAELCKGPETPMVQAAPRHRTATLDITRASPAVQATLIEASTLSSSSSSPSLTVQPSSSAGTAQQAPQSDVPLRVFEMLSELVLDRQAYLFRFADSVNIKWLLLFFHPRVERRAAVLALELLASLLKQPQLGYTERLNTAGGFKVLERLVPRFWSTPMVIAMLWSAFFGVEAQTGPSLLSSFSPLADGRERHIACPHIIRAILSCAKEGLRSLAARHDEPRRRAQFSKGRPSGLLEPPFASSSARPKHARKRSQSMNMDVKTLHEAFQASTEVAVLKETFELIRTHAVASAYFRDILFSPIVLRGFIDAIFPFVGITAGSGPIDEADRQIITSVLNIGRSALDLLAQLAVESITSARSVAVIGALTAALPPTDLAQQATFRTCLYELVCFHLRAALVQQPNALKDAAEAVAAFIEKASEEILSGSPLEDSLFEIVIGLLSNLDPNNERDSCATSTLLLSLNRILLHRLALDDRTTDTFTEITETQALIFLDANKDSSFFECLQNRVLYHLFHGDQATKLLAFGLLKLMTLSRPAIVESILADGRTAPDLLGCDVDMVAEMLRADDGGSVGSSDANLPYRESWEGFFKSRETLKAAAHLERVQQLHEMLRRVDTREQAVINTETRMVAWHASLCEAEQSRYAKFVNDSLEMNNFAAAEWRTLLGGLERERALFGPEDGQADTMWKLDATEGPSRIRLKLQPVPPQEKETDEAPYRRESVVSQTVAPSSPTGVDAPALGHGDDWGSGDMGRSPDLRDDDSIVVNSSDFNPDAQPVADLQKGKGRSYHKPQQPSSSSASAAFQEETSQDQAESFHEDKYRRVLRSLERGDIIQAVYNTSRVVGIESRGCLLILGKTCIYLMDDYFQRPNGELINVWEAPPEERDTLVMATLSSDASRPSGLIAQLEGDAQTRKWPWSAVQVCHRRSWLHRRTAVEIFFEDGQSSLLVCRQTVTANKLYQELKVRAPSAVAAAEGLREGIREGSLMATSTPSSFGSRLAGAVLGRSQQWGTITTTWREGRMSNFAYLMELNTLAGRSMNDLTQFPCFPWVLADYTSAELDLTNPATFRKFELPMGAQTPVRRREFEERYGQLVEVDMEPFHYGTHYSTAATVCGYLIRMRPFDRLLIALQGGNFDLADRTFSSIGKAWLSASELSRGDVRELVPEFFFLPEFLSNTNRFNFGITQAGERIDGVELPPWAKGDPRLFIQKHREALECEYVSQRLHNWIDLIFGYRSRGKEAVESTNVFHPLSYEDAVDLDAIESSMERQATAQVIHNFGQTPSRLFSQPHPQRMRAEVPTLPVGERFGLLENPELVIQNFAPIRTLKNPVHFIYPFHPEKAFASPRDYLILPKLGVSLSFAHLDGSIRMFSSKDLKRPLAVTEQVSADRITCVAEARPKTFVMGSADGLVSVWMIDVAKKELALSQVLRGHTESVLCLAASSDWSIVVSGSTDKTAIVWDLNRGVYVRSLRGHDAPVHLVAIDDKSGYIATAFGPGVRLWSINGELLASVATSASILEPVTSLAFYQRDYHVGRLAMLLTGHRGKVVAWSAERAKDKDETEAICPREGGGRWTLSPYHVFTHQDRLAGAGSVPPVITAITSTHKVLFTGDEHGRLYLWTLAGEAVPVPDGYSLSCMSAGCGRRFGVLESRRACAGCGGIFCGACATPVAVGGWGASRFCPACAVVVQSQSLSSSASSSP